MATPRTWYGAPFGLYSGCRRDGSDCSNIGEMGIKAGVPPEATEWPGYGNLRLRVNLSPLPASRQGELVSSVMSALASAGLPSLPSRARNHRISIA